MILHKKENTARIIAPVKKSNLHQSMPPGKVRSPMAALEVQPQQTGFASFGIALLTMKRKGAAPSMT